MCESPFRRPDWRWRLVNRLLVEKLPCRAETQDEWVQRILKHLRSTGVGEGSRSRRRVRHDPILAEAFAIQFAADPLFSAELQSWILTGEPAPFVAEVTGLDEGVIAAYEQCFFDVRPKLEVWSYIIHMAIGPSVYEGFSLDVLAPIWKTIAYFRGRFSLAVTLQAFPGSRVRRRPDWFPASPARQARLIRVCRGAILARCLPRNVSSIKYLKVLLQLQAAAEADYQEQYWSLEPFAPPLTSATISSAFDMGESNEPVPSATECGTESGAATAKLTESCRRIGLQETLTG
jgi:hypothetical protein